MSARIITLTAAQFADLRGKGQTFHDPGALTDMVRLIRDGSGYGPLPGADSEIVLTGADLDVIEHQPEGLVVGDTTIRSEVAR